MTGRIRSVKPEWLEDELMVNASSDARVLSIGLILLADDYGNGRGSDLYLMTRVFPGAPRETLVNALEELSRLSFVTRYTVDGQTYFHIRNWTKHQRVDHPGKPQVPEFVDVLESSGDSRETLRKEKESLAPRAIPSLPIPIQSFPDPKTRASRARPMPDGWTPNASNVALCSALGLILADEELTFREWTGAQGRKYVDWHLAFASHLRRSAERKGKGKSSDKLTGADMRRMLGGAQ